MSKIKIETLTAVHIGSGETLQYNNDYIKGKNKDGYDILGIIEPRKVMNLIGEEHINEWVTSIESNKPTSEIIKIYAPNATIDSYSKRIILFFADKTTTELKEQIHDGMGRPYIPGSSIKGAIRTSILASLINKNDEGLIFTKDKFGTIKKDKKGNVLVNATAIEKKYFSSIDSEVSRQLHITDSNSDIFRFLQVGDAYFGKNYEIALRMVNINEREHKNFWDESKQQMIEAICPEDEAFFELKINIDGYKLSQEKKAVHTMPHEMQSIGDLFQLINQHTTSLIESDIEFWKDRTEKDDSGRTDDYIESMSNILAVARSCNTGKECVLRIGHGSGWRFMTGAWTEDFDNFQSVVIPASRPKNFNYEQFDFPKSRRVSDGCELLGFVKLTLSPEK